MTGKTFRARLAQACRIMRDVRDVPTPELRRAATSALVPLSRPERRVLAAVARSRVVDDAVRSQRPYVAPRRARAAR